MKNHRFCQSIQRFRQEINHAIGYPIVVATIVTLFAWNGLASAESRPAEFVPFRDFVNQTAAASASDYLARPESRVKDTASFEEMRQHVLNLYKGVEVYHSFVLDSGHYDCIPIEQQPAVRKYGLKSIASPPVLEETADANGEALDGFAKPALQLDPDKPFDTFGNSVHCEEHTIPMRRVTLDTLTRFQTLRQFFQKSPEGAERVAGQNPEFTPGGAAHKYSFTFETVDNLGGNSNLNVWSPFVDTSKGEVFSLSQEWYVGGSGANTQTDEVGWVVYPDMFGDEKSHFFIFSTPDNYVTGCWNNSCGDFVQTGSSGLLGASFNHYSAFGKTQYEFSARYYLHNGNWWLYYGGKAVGYYPLAMYKGGQNSKHAQVIEFGTESVGTTVWPPEGSGDWPSKGFKYAAYQRNLYYTNTSKKKVWDSLSPDIPSPACYSVGGPNSGTGAWTVYFYEGGPGGSGC